MHFIHSSMLLTWKKFPFSTQRKNSKRDSRPVFRFKIQAWHSFHYFLTSLKFHNYDVTPMLYFSTPNQNTYSITRSRYLLQKRSKRATAMNFVHFCVTLVNRKVLRWGASSFTAQSYTRARGRTIDHEFPARTGKLARKWRTVNVKKVFFYIRPVWSDFFNVIRLCLVCMCLVILWEFWMIRLHEKKREDLS